MANDETRVLLIKPGDVLLIGNAGRLGDPDMVRSAAQALDYLGIKTVVFAADVDISKLPANA